MAAENAHSKRGLIKQAERELLLKERRARQEAEREKEELMKRLQQYEEEAKAANQALVWLNCTISYKL